MIEDEKPRCQLDLLKTPLITVTTANPAAPLLIKSNSTDTIATLITFIKLTQMIRTLIITFVLSLPAMLVAFSTKPNRIVVRQPAAARTTLYYHPDVFEKAVDCAQNYGMCDVDELLNLAKGEVLLASKSTTYPSTSLRLLTHTLILSFAPRIGSV